MGPSAPAMNHHTIRARARHSENIPSDIAGRSALACASVGAPGPYASRDGARNTRWMMAPAAAHSSRRARRPAVGHSAGVDTSPYCRYRTYTAGSLPCGGVTCNSRIEAQQKEPCARHRYISSGAPHPISVLSDARHLEVAITVPSGRCRKWLPAITAEPRRTVIGHTSYGICHRLGGTLRAASAGRLAPPFRAIHANPGRSCQALRIGCPVPSHQGCPQ